MPKAARRRSPDDHTPFPHTPCLARNFDRYRLLSRAAAAAAFTLRLTFPFPQPSFSPQLVPSHPPNHFPTRTKHRVPARKKNRGKRHTLSLKTLALFTFFDLRCVASIVLCYLARFASSSDHVSFGPRNQAKTPTLPVTSQKIPATTTPEPAATPPCPFPNSECKKIKISPV
jgi:hypothetical protein